TVWSAPTSAADTPWASERRLAHRGPQPVYDGGSTRSCHLAAPSPAPSHGPPSKPANGSSTMSSHSFDQAIALTAVAPNLYKGSTSDAFKNMVGPFGGLTAAILLNAVLQHPERLGDPVSLTVNFAGPVGDGDFEVEATPLRT